MAKGKKDKISKYYSEWWENPKDPRNIVFEGLNNLVKERIHPGNNRKALDIGSGKGRIMSYLLEKGYKVTAVEMILCLCIHQRELSQSLRVQDFL